MTLDPDALNVTINYSGGSITLPVGNAKDLFGDNPELLRPTPVDLTISKKAHSRIRVIGEPATNVSASTYTVTQWPRTRRSNAAGGEAIVMRWENSEGDWVARMTGPAYELGTFLNETSPKAVSFYTKGSKYGPFIKEGE